MVHRITFQNAQTSGTVSDASFRRYRDRELGASDKTSAIKRGSFCDSVTLRKDLGVQIIFIKRPCSAGLYKNTVS